MENSSLSLEIKGALVFVSKLLKVKNTDWYLRGSAGLVLQGFSLQVGDIDIETDEKNGILGHKCLEEYSVIPYGPSIFENFRDFYGRYMIKGIKVELLHDIHVRRLPYHYHSVINDRMKQFSSKIDVSGETINVMPLEENLCLKFASGQIEKCRQLMAQTVFLERVNIEYLKLRIAETGLDHEGAKLLNTYTSYKWDSYF